MMLNMKIDKVVVAVAPVNGSLMEVLLLLLLSLSSFHPLDHGSSSILLFIVSKIKSKSIWFMILVKLRIKRVNFLSVVARVDFL